MDPNRTAQWLLDHAGPVIRYRVGTECPAAQPPVDIETLTTELLENVTVCEWLGNLRSYESLVEDARHGKGLGAGGNSSFLHGPTDMNFEVVLPKLAQLGLRAGLPVLDEKTDAWLRLLEAELNRDLAKARLDETRFLSVVYYYHDKRLIIASSLASAGYQTESVKRVIWSRLDAIYEVVKNGNFDIYEEPGKIKMSPKEWGDHLLKWDLYADGNIKLPFVHDISGYASLYKLAGREAKQKIGTLIHWILSPEHQQFWYNFGYIRLPEGGGKSVGYKMDFPGYFGFEGQDFDPLSLVLRCWQMAHFPESRQHPWFRNSMQHLESFITQNGTYLFPKRYLTETRQRAYWIHGGRMGLGENRRNPIWREIESTFWMLAIHLALESAG
jgi:hypothetical protein